MVADKNHFGAFVIAREEQVQQHEKTLGDVLAAFVHGTGHVQQAEHDGLRGRLRQTDAVVVAQVEGIDKRHRIHAGTQLRNLAAQAADFGMFLQRLWRKVRDC